MMKPLPFATLRDNEGAVTLGWAGDTVIYSLVKGGLSAELGARFANEIQILITGLTGIHYFSDAAALTRYDLLARSAFVRMALANRKRFESFTILTWPSEVTPAVQSFTAALGDNVTLCQHAADFERRLHESAPLARYRINPANGERFESAERDTR
jgi:hypothetical protein